MWSVGRSCWIGFWILESGVVCEIACQDGGMGVVGRSRCWGRRAETVASQFIARPELSIVFRRTDGH